MKKYFIVIVSILIVSLSVGCPFTTPGAMNQYIANYPEWIREIGNNEELLSDEFIMNQDSINCFSHFASKLTENKKCYFNFNYDMFYIYDKDSNKTMLFDSYFGVVHDINDAAVYIEISDSDIFEYYGYVYNEPTHVRFEKTDDGFNVYFSNENGNAGPIHFTRK